MHPQTPGTHWPWSYLTWPNRISMLRLLLIPPFVMLMLHQRGNEGFRRLAMGIFAVMAISDWLDGYLARRLKVASRLGAFLDPLADKALIICSAVLLSLPGSQVGDLRLPDWVVVMIVGKDLWVIIGSVVVFMIAGRLKISPTIWGKLCTDGQLAMVFAFLLSPELDKLRAGLGFSIAHVLWWVVAALCALAVVSYTRLGIAFLAEHEAGHK